MRRDSKETVRLEGLFVLGILLGNLDSVHLTFLTVSHKGSEPSRP